MRLKILGALLATALVTPASAGTLSAVALDQAKESDLNKVICRTENVTGSRLGQRKRCMTLRDWEEYKLAERQSLERSQANRYKGNEGGAPGANAFGRFN